MNFSKSLRDIFKGRRFLGAMFPILVFGIVTLVDADELDPYLKIKGTETGKKILQMARKTILFYLKTGKTAEPDFSLESPWLGSQAGVFVTLVKKNHVRSCVGSFFPEEKSFLDAVVNTAVKSTYFDTRFSPVEVEEVPDLRIIISVTGKMTPVDDPYSVNFFTYGVLIKQGNRSAVLLPGEAKTVNWGIKSLMKESGIKKDISPIEYCTFKTITIEEE